MSHLHAPDGVIPLWLCAIGWLAALAFVGVASWWSDRDGTRRRVALLAVVAAMMLVAMSAEVIPIAYHFNLTVVGGMLLGPALSVVAAFVVEVVLAMLGHGGITVLGINTVVLSAEMIAGALLLRGLTRMLGRPRLRSASLAATMIALALASTLMVGVVALAAGGSGVLERGSRSTRAVAASDHDDGDLAALSPKRFAALVYTVGPLGWLAEGLLTAWILGYVDRVRPSLLWTREIDSEHAPPPGDENRR